jgi:hypothetical protein
MALLGESFDINSIPEQQNDFSPLPEGWYNAVINKAEIRDTKDKTGQYVAVRYDVTGPTHQGRVVFGNINIKNKSTQAEEIGRQALGSIMRAIGLSRVDDTDQLIGGALQIKLSIRTQEGYEPTNDVRGYKSLGGASMPGVMNKEDAALFKQDDGKAAPPWAKK